MATRSYTDDEVQAILRRAIERQQAESDGLGHDELVAAAREIGLDDAAIDRAVTELEHEDEGKALAAKVKARKRSAFWKHLFTYLIIVGSMLGLHFVGLAGAWVFWVVFGWGAGVLLSMPRAFREPSEQELEDASRKQNRRDRRRQMHQARKLEREREEERRRMRRLGIKSPAQTEIEHAVE